MSLTLLSFLLNSRVMYPRPTKASRDTTDDTHRGDGENALSSPLLPLTIIGDATLFPHPAVA